MSQSLLLPQQFLDEAIRLAGLNDFGSNDFREPMERFLASCKKNAFLNGQGVDAVNGTVLKALINRLRFEDALKKHPEILDINIDDPLIIIGLPRVGSTKLHRLLASNTEVHAFQYWQLLNPSPFPDAENKEGEEDPRIVIAKHLSDQMLASAPDFFAGYLPIADEPDEDQWLLDLTFMQTGFILLGVATEYMEWLSQQDMTNTYAYMKRLQQFMIWQTKSEGKPLVLKAPTHTLALDILAKLYPKAKFVQPHRNPVVSVISVVNLLQAAIVVNTTKPQLEVVNCIYGELTLDMAAKGLAFREDIGEHRFLDVYYDDIHEDAMPVVEKIYQFWGIPLTVEAKNTILNWEANHPQHVHGKFSYSIEESSISTDYIIKRTAPYLRRFFPELLKSNSDKAI